MNAVIDYTYGMNTQMLSQIVQSRVNFAANVTRMS